jgi:hypothetical protein
MFELRSPDFVNLAGEETGRNHLSHSSLGMLLACQERFNLHYERRLRPAVTAEPLAIGSGFAQALEIGDPEVAWATVLGQYEAELDANGGNPWVSFASREEVEIGAQIAREAARCYLKSYGVRGETRELEMRVRIRNPEVGGRVSATHDLLGRVDAVDLENAVLVEDKLSSSMMRSNLRQRVRLDRQVSIGCYLVWRTTGVLIRDVKYRVTLKPGIKLRQNETHEAFLERIAEDYATRSEHYLIEEAATRDESDFLRLERELWRWAETVREARKDGTWPRNSAACLEYGGCRYLPLCAGEPGAENQYREFVSVGVDDKRQEVMA